MVLFDVTVLMKLYFIQITWYLAFVVSGYKIMKWFLVVSVQWTPWSGSVKWLCAQYTVCAVFFWWCFVLFGRVRKHFALRAQKRGGLSGTGTGGKGAKEWRLDRAHPPRRPWTAARTTKMLSDKIINMMTVVASQEEERKKEKKKKEGSVTSPLRSN